MIAYEELEKALTRWKSRRPDAMAPSPRTSSGAGGGGMMDANEATAMGGPDLEVTRMGEADGGEDLGIPTGIGESESSADESTGELEIGDGAIVDDR